VNEGGALELSFLGPPEVRFQGRAVNLRTRKTLAVLAFLALEGGMQPRARLTALLWPELEETQARGNLRNVLTYLRDALGGEAHLRIERQTVGLREETVRIDVRELERVSQAGSEPEKLERVLRSYRGELLEAFALPDAPEFDDWLATQRELVRQRFDTMLEALLEVFEGRNELDRALEVARRRLRLEPLNEVAHRQVIGLQLRLGNRGAALEAYRTCQTVLRRELGVEPSPQTTQLISKLEAGTREARPSDSGQAQNARGAESANPIPENPIFENPVPRNAPKPDELPLVGRERELGRLREAARQGKLIFVSGDAGVGKTRLIHAFAQERGLWDVLRGRPTDVGVPYAIIARAIRNVNATLPNGRVPLPAWAERELSRLVPELETDPTPPITSNDERLRLFDAFIAWGLKVFAQHATIVLDDLHLWDSLSFEMGAYAAVSALERPGRPLVVIAAFRRGELPTEIERRVYAQIEAGRAVLIELEPLGTDGVRDLVQSAGTEISAAQISPDQLETVARNLTRFTGGNPLFILETLRAGANLDRLEGLPRSEKVSQVIGRRLERLSKAARDLSRVAAITGEGFSLALASRVLEADALALADASEELEQAGVMRLDHFTHDLLAETVLDGIPRSARTVLHARALAALESDQEALNIPAATLARHATMAALPEAIVRHSIKAGDEAFRLYAMSEAVEHYERAQAALLSNAGLLERLPPADRQRLYTNLGYALDYLGQDERSRHAYERLLAFGDERRDPGIQATAYNRLAYHATNVGVDLEKAAELYHRALEAASRTTDPVAGVETRISLAWLENQRWQLPTALEHASLALEHARALGQVQWSLEALEAVFNIELNLGRWQASRDHAQEALELARTAQVRVSEAHALAMMAYCALFLGDPRQGVREARDALGICLEIRWLAGQGFAERVLALGLLELGAFSDAIGFAQRSLRTAHTRQSALGIIYGLIALGRCQTVLGQLGAARTAFLEARDLCQANAARIAQRRPMLAFLDANLAGLCGLEGDWDATASLARSALQNREPGYAGWFALSPRWLEAEALAHAGHADLARADVEALSANVREQPRSRVTALRALASLAQLESRYEEAIALLEEARSISLRLDLQLETMGIEIALAASLEAGGRTREALEARHSALEITQSLAESIEDPEDRASFLVFMERQIGLSVAQEHRSIP
jgi:DNA-binding SARP family transcriptional activator/tetratricopeptide (TPR) repeat protein